MEAIMFINKDLLGSLAICEEQNKWIISNFYVLCNTYIKLQHSCIHALK